MDTSNSSLQYDQRRIPKPRGRRPRNLAFYKSRMIEMFEAGEPVTTIQQEVNRTAVPKVNRSTICTRLTEWGYDALPKTTSAQQLQVSGPVLNTKLQDKPAPIWRNFYQTSSSARFLLSIFPVDLLSASDQSRLTQYITEAYLSEQSSPGYSSKFSR